ncbi:MAG: zinc-ribbon domain-containing protein [Muribaculaceae bacterium]|nr:zinc-ribbon domain-containing protein [Muribaculaceae bacterium]
MELQCPQCNKTMQISAEEVALHGGAVVCPQCLAVFDASGNVPEGTVAERVTVRVVEEHLTYGYCTHCGSKIPQGVNFCPYCGKSLKSLPGQQNEASPEIVETKPDIEDTVTRHIEEPADKTKVVTPKPAAPRAWNPILPSYRYAKNNMSWRSGNARAGTWFTLGALVVIAAQLALLAYIIYKVSLLN